MVTKILKEYQKKYKPEKWLFPSLDKDKYLTTRTVQRIFLNTCKRAEIKKEVLNKMR
ncbi:hypothetical protein B9J77_01920 [candidate division NPL-UPA2 bacterium Unc8]|uniref:Integrase n=1 Tax=candidate division NPL-UPA2 bacterium Unc8 TaxID=1980939 RepID=A0A399FYQ5_UNCN2|nr:MAG: hypothetical protein B9J77_01920 [candidate division NPL-UPA2 bacterium Unc8]